RLPRGVALEGVQMALRVDRHRGDAAATLRQREGIRIREAQVGRPQFVADDVALQSPGTDRRLRARFGAAVALKRASLSAAGGRSLLAVNTHEQYEERATENGQDLPFHCSLLGDAARCDSRRAASTRLGFRRRIISVSQPGMAGKRIPFSRVIPSPTM